MTPIPEKTLALLLAQYNAERNASAVYSAISSALSNGPFKGFAKYFLEESEFETAHSHMIKEYLDKRNVATVTAELPSVSYGSLAPVQAVKLAADLEQSVTALINGIYDAALSEKDFNTLNFLSFFLEEQVNAEAELQDLLLKLQLAGTDAAALLELDEHISA